MLTNPMLTNPIHLMWIPTNPAPDCGCSHDAMFPDLPAWQLYSPPDARRFPGSPAEMVRWPTTRFPRSNAVPWRETPDDFDAADFGSSRDPTFFYKNGSSWWVIMVLDHCKQCFPNGWFPDSWYFLTTPRWFEVPVIYADEFWLRLQLDDVQFMVLRLKTKIA